MAKDMELSNLGASNTVQQLEQPAKVSKAQPVPSDSGMSKIGRLIANMFSCFMEGLAKLRYFQTTKNAMQNVHVDANATTPASSAIKQKKVFGSDAYSEIAKDDPYSKILQQQLVGTSKRGQQYFNKVRAETEQQKSPVTNEEAAEIRKQNRELEGQKGDALADFLRANLSDKSGRVEDPNREIQITQKMLNVLKEDLDLDISQMTVGNKMKLLDFHSALSKLNGRMIEKSPNDSKLSQGTKDFIADYNRFINTYVSSKHNPLL